MATMRTSRREILLLFFVTLYCALTVNCTSQIVNKQKEKTDTPMADSSQKKKCKSRGTRQRSEKKRDQGRTRAGGYGKNTQGTIRG